MALLDSVRQWEVRFQTLSPLEHFPQVNEIVYERQVSPKYHLEGAGRPENQTQIVCTLSGEGAFRYGSQVHRLTPGRGFICANGDPASAYYYPRNATEPWFFIWIDFCNAMAVDMLEDIVARHGHVVDIPLDSGFVRYLKAFHDKQRSVRFVTAAEGGKIACDAMAHLCELLDRDELASHGTQLVRMTQLLITENLDRNMGIQEIADRLQVSREHLSRIFRERTGMSPQDFALKERMETAARLMRDAGETCTRVAQRLGYANGVSFSRAFRQFHGMNPGQYRKQMIASGEKKEENGTEDAADRGRSQTDKI